MRILKHFNIRGRIFLAMMSAVMISSLLTASVVVFHFEKTNREYHGASLKQKESTISTSIGYIIAKTPEKATPENIQSILEMHIYELSEINKLDINIFTLKGDLCISSSPPLISEGPRHKISPDILAQLSKKSHIRIAEQKPNDPRKYLSEYSFIYNPDQEPVAILNLPYIQDNTFLLDELHAFLKNVSILYLLIIIGAAFLSLYLSKTITKQLEIIQNRLKQTQLNKRNAQIQYNRRDELRPLVNAYNEMVAELEKSTELLAKTAREYAWREMARQIAHEIKNPLTPMRLMMQNLMKRYDPTAPDAAQKLRSFSNSMIQQIDTLSTIASAFSGFARMPAPSDEAFALDPALATTLELFDRQRVCFEPGAGGAAIFMDKSQLNRLITNIVKNALQAIPPERRPAVHIRSSVKDDSHAIIEIQDNGCGISSDLQELIFEPRFTTKTSGTGLGLAMVKSIIKHYDGKIYFKTKWDVGTSFYIELPIKNTAL